MYEYTCPACKTAAYVADSTSGDTTECPGCGRWCKLAFTEGADGPVDAGQVGVPWWAAPKGVGACGAAGVGAAICIILVWAAFGRGTVGAIAAALYLLAIVPVGFLAAFGAFLLLRPPSAQIGGPAVASSPPPVEDEDDADIPVLDAAEPAGQYAAPPLAANVPTLVPNIVREPAVPPRTTRSENRAPSTLNRSTTTQVPGPGETANRASAEVRAAAAPVRPLLQRTTCGHCWSTFRPEDALWISTHTDLLGDPRLGREHQQRFLPTRFTANGDALDAHGFPCSALACPNCHLSIPRGLLEMEPFFVSVLGAIGSGKSYLLASMIWQLREILSRDFAIDFQDADLVNNRALNQYEASLFMNPRQEEFIPLGDLILKTQTAGQLDDEVSFGNQTVRYPRPFQFTLTPSSRHPNASAGQRLARMLCLYDNAGEHFEPGMDTNQNQATRHLAQSRLLLFLFDPTQDHRFRQKCLTAPPPAQASLARQDLILLEVASRIRRHTNASQASKHPHPLIVLVTKCDVWQHLLDKGVLGENPWKPTRKGIFGLDVGRIDQVSRQLKKLLRDTCPELVAAAESFAERVTFLPVSALGQVPRVDTGSGKQLVRPRDVRPLWTAVPMVYGLQGSLKGLIPALKPPSSATASSSGAASAEFWAARASAAERKGK